MSVKAKRILVVDDEEDILNLLSYNLKKAGFEVLTAMDGPEALEIAVKELPGLILLDIMLPNMEGTEVLKRLKADPSTIGVPVIMLTAKGEEIDRIVGFELGADDYITKPFSPRELILRVRAIFKRAGDAPTPAPASTGDVMSFAELTLNKEKHRVTVGTEVVELTSREFKLLSALLGARGRVLTQR